MLVLLLCLACAAYANYPIHVKDARGKEITIKAKPVRIISLTPNNTEILYALGLGSRVIGVTKYCNYPPEAQKKTKIGDMSVNVEAVVALKPDLVLAHANLNDSVIPQLEKLGLTVFALNPKTIESAISDLRTVGKICGRPKTADSVAKKMQASFKAVKAECANKKQTKVLVEIQSNPLWVAGPKTFVDEMLNTVNATNIASDARPGFVTFSKELAVSRNPDVIIVGLKSDADYFMKDPAWKHTSAVKNKKVYVINNDTLVRPTPRLVTGLKALAEKVRR